MGGCYYVEGGPVSFRSDVKSLSDLEKKYDRFCKGCGEPERHGLGAFTYAGGRGRFTVSQEGAAEHIPETYTALAEFLSQVVAPRTRIAFTAADDGLGDAKGVGERIGFGIERGKVASIVWRPYILTGGGNNDGTKSYEDLKRWLSGSTSSYYP